MFLQGDRAVDGSRGGLGGWPLTLATTSVALVTIITAGSVAARAASEQARHAVLIDEILQRTALDVSEEESLERLYLLEPTPEVRRRNAQAVDDVDRAMQDLEARGETADRAFAERVRHLNAGYAAAHLALFAARDKNEPEEEIEQVDDDQIDPVFSQIEAQVAAAASEHRAGAISSTQRAAQTGTVVIAIDVLTVLLSLIAFALVGRRIARVQRALRAQGEAFAHQALHDALTGLPNRTFLNQEAEKALRAPGADADGVAVLLLDLDRFRHVNDTLGHHAGDELLLEVSKRLTAAVQDSGTVARLGGDEFAVLLPSSTSEHAVEVAGRITRAMFEAVQVRGIVVDVEASIGIAVSCGDDDVRDLLQRADVAMYQAKERHLPHALYDGNLDLNTPARLSLLGDVRRALSGNELHLHYQPKVSADSGRIHGVEALLRWNHPQRGPIPPGVFIPAVEATGLIDELTTHVLRLALGQQRTWLGRGLALPVAVNISARSLLDHSFPDRVAALLDEFGVPAQLLFLELTESTIMADPDGAVTVLERLTMQGIRLAIDDFGTGYSSMAYLKRLPVAELKIDRSFVIDMQTEANNRTLIQSIIDLGHNLGLQVVAEGVEDEITLRRLGDMGCDLAQGYHVLPPVPPTKLEEWLSGSNQGSAVAASGWIPR